MHIVIIKEEILFLDEIQNALTDLIRRPIPNSPACHGNIHMHASIYKRTPLDHVKIILKVRQWLISVDGILMGAPGITGEARPPRAGRELPVCQHLSRTNGAALFKGACGTSLSGAK